EGALGRRRARARGDSRCARGARRQAHQGAADRAPRAQALERARRTRDARAVSARPGESALAQRLRREIDGEVLFDAATRGRYSTDASIYQVEPIGVVVPRTAEAARAAIAIAAEQGVAVLPRGAGSSQCGQAVGAALVIDHTKHLNKVLEKNLQDNVVVA